MYNFSVPQGSILVPLLFTLLAAPISNAITSVGIDFRQCADDVQLYFTVDRSNVDAKLQDLWECSRALAASRLVPVE